MAEFAIGQLFALNRRVVEAHNQVQHGIELMDFVGVNNEVEVIFHLDNESVRVWWTPEPLAAWLERSLSCLKWGTTHQMFMKD